MDVEYLEIREKKLAANSICEVCNKFEAMHIHHVQGRLGDKLTEWDNLLAVCWQCHNNIHNSPAWAYEMGYMKRRITDHSPLVRGQDE